LSFESSPLLPTFTSRFFFTKIIDMKTAIKFFAFVFLAAITLETRGQDNEKGPRNFAGVSGAVVFGHTSSTYGLEYERYILTRRKFALGVRAGYLFPYRAGNTSFCLSEECGGWPSGKFSHGQAAVTGYFFTSDRPSFNRFFLHAAIGLTYSRHKTETYTAISTIPGFDLGLGWQFRLGNRLNCRWVTSWSLYIRSEDGEKTEESPGDILATKFYIGF
jgi:hypothetical protein